MPEIDITLTKDEWREVHMALSRDTMLWNRRIVPRAPALLSAITVTCKGTEDETVTVVLPKPWIWTIVDLLPRGIRTQVVEQFNAQLAAESFDRPFAELTN